MNGKTITCMAGEMGDYLANELGHPMDLDSNLYKGFTIGKRGKTMYWCLIWHAKNCSASIYTAEHPMRRAYIRNDQQITIHFR